MTFENIIKTLGCIYDPFVLIWRKLNLYVFKKKVFSKLICWKVTLSNYWGKKNKKTTPILIISIIIIIMIIMSYYMIIITLKFIYLFIHSFICMIISLNPKLFQEINVWITNYLPDLSIQRFLSNKCTIF